MRNISDPLTILEEEHRLILRVIAAMEREAARIREGAPLDKEAVLLAIEFFSSFAERRHHGKEETLLFPKLASKKDIIRDGPVKVLTGEHDAGRYFVNELKQGISGLETGDIKSNGRIERALSLYAQMLRKHIAKEEEIVFLLARILLSAGEMDELAVGFSSADENAGDSFQHFVVIAERLEGMEEDDRRASTSAK